MTHHRPKPNKPLFESPDRENGFRLGWFEPCKKIRSFKYIKRTSWAVDKSAILKAAISGGMGISFSGLFPFRLRSLCKQPIDGKCKRKGAKKRKIPFLRAPLAFEPVENASWDRDFFLILPNQVFPFTAGGSSSPFAQKFLPLWISFSPSLRG